MQPMIRLRRGGKRHQASFRIVVAQKSEAADGDYLESLGRYNPRTQPSLIKLNASRALYWLHQGAQPSDTVRSILRRTGVWEKFHEGAGPDDLAADEETVFHGPEGMSEKTSVRAQQAKAAGEQAKAETQAAEAAEAAEEKAAEAEPAAEPTEEAEPEAEAEPEPVAEEEEQGEAESDEAEPAAEAEEEEEVVEASADEEAEPEAEEEEADEAEEDEEDDEDEEDKD